MVLNILYCIFAFFIQSSFTDLLKDNNKENDYYEGIFFHIQSFDIIYLSSKRYKDKLRVIFYQWLESHLGLDVLSNQKNLESYLRSLYFS